MRIFFFLNHDVYPITVGGMELFDHHFIAKLSTKHEVGVASRTFPNNVRENDNFKWFPIKKYRPNLILTTFQYLFLTLKNSKKYDVFILPFATYGGWHLWYHYILFLPISFFLKKRFIVVIHSGIEKGCKPFAVYKLIFKNSTLVGVGNKISEFYRSYYKVPVNYIPSVLPLVKSKSNREELRNAFDISQSDIVLLYVGSFRRIKNVNLIVDSLKNLGSPYVKENRIKLICLGEGETRKENEKEVKINGLAMNVSFLGNKPREEVAAYYKLSDALICASSYESLGQILIEALYNDLPIIASEAVAYNAFLNPENALLFKPNDSNSLSQKIKYFVENIFTKKIIMEPGSNTYDKYFDFDAMIHSYEKLFEDVIVKNK